jgi:AcrR family transcriptional regulator
MNVAKLDARIERTRSALLRAFREVILANRFAEISVADIAKRAKVSRSTLYQHFPGKDALLAASIAVPFSVLAQTLNGGADNARLVALLEHFWGNRPLARVIFGSPLRRKCVAVLVLQIEQVLKTQGLARRGALQLPLRLAAVQLAELLLAPVIAWLLGESRCSAHVLAQALQQVATAALQALGAARARS